jgi:hypothetical protein
MSFTLEDALEILEDTEVELIRQFPIELTQQIAQLLTPEEFREYIFARNMKIFGGINQYANNFFDKGTIQEAINRPMKVAVIGTLMRILSEPGLTEENKQRISQAVRNLHASLTASAPAAGGRSKKLKRRD